MHSQTNIYGQFKETNQSEIGVAEDNHACTGITCYLQTQGLEPRTFFLDSNSANNYTTTQPHFET